MSTKCNLILISLLYYAAVVATQDIKMIIPLNKTLTYDDREIYGRDIVLNGSSTLQVNFSDVNKNISFIIFQAHSHIHEITVSNKNNTNFKNSSITGNNVGLVSFTDTKLDTLYVVNPNINVTVSIYISVHGYMAEDPVPGGCNLDFDVPIPPYLRTTFDSNYVTVDASPPSTTKICNKIVPTTTFYMMYLPEMNFDSDVYFDGIKKMMTLKNIQENGWEIPLYTSVKTMRRLVGAYPTMGTVYVVVTQTASGYAVYVPSVTYACTPTDDDGCELINDLLSKMMCAVLFLMGIFLCYLGHRFFKTEMFLAGFFSGVIITYILVAIITVIDKPALVAASTLSGLFFGAIWLAYWWLYGIPVMAVLLPSLHLGFLLSAIFYYRLPAVHLLLDIDFNFWCTFIMIMLLASLALISIAYAANILCCSVLGAYAAVFAFDYSVGSNLKYIIVNTIRRATVPKFNQVTLAPPFQWRDTMMVLLWIVLAVSGFVFQHYHNRGRPPFPPPPRNTRLSVPEERMYGTIATHVSRRPREENTENADERTTLLA